MLALRIARRASERRPGAGATAIESALLTSWHAGNALPPGALPLPAGRNRLPGPIITTSTPRRAREAAVALGGKWHRTCPVSRASPRRERLDRPPVAKTSLDTVRVAADPSHRARPGRERPRVDRGGHGDPPFSAAFRPRRQERRGPHGSRAPAHRLRRAGRHLHQARPDAEHARRSPPSRRHRRAVEAPRRGSSRSLRADPPDPRGRPPRIEARVVRVDRAEP